MLIASGEPKMRDTAPMDASNALLSSKHDSETDGVSTGSISHGCLEIFRVLGCGLSFTLICI